MRKLGDETVVVNVKMPRAMRDAIEQKRVDDGLSSLSEAARALLTKGLNGRAPRKRKETGGNAP